LLGLKKFGKTIFGLVIGTAASAGLIVYALLPETIRWSEEVKLSSGQLIVVKRAVTFGGPHELAQPESPTLWWLEFAAPGGNGNRIAFESELTEHPILLEFENGVPFVATYLATGAVRNKYRCPNPPYLFYRYTGGHWEVIGLAEFPEKFSVANIAPYTNSVNQRARRFGTIAWAEKREFWNDVGLIKSVKEFRRPNGNRTTYGQYGCPERG
jgi:hypothetical protein